MYIVFVLLLSLPLAIFYPINDAKISQNIAKFESLLTRVKKSSECNCETTKTSPQNTLMSRWLSRRQRLGMSSQTTTK